VPRDRTRERVVEALWTLLDEGLLTSNGGHYDAFWSYLRCYDELVQTKEQLQEELDLTEYGYPAHSRDDLVQEARALSDEQESQQV
jgi:hypothetical protein